MYIGYARVSTQDQNLEMQLDALTKANCIKIFEEKVSGRVRERPELQNMLAMLRPGDTVVVYKLDRIGRSMKHLIEVVEYFRENEIEFVSLHENIDTGTVAGRFLFNVMAALAEFERDQIAERTKSGLAAARARGRVGGRPKADQKKITVALQLYDSKQHSVKEICEMSGISQKTLYNYVNNRKKEQKKDE